MAFVSGPAAQQPPPGERAEESAHHGQRAGDSVSQPVPTWLLLRSDGPQGLVRKVPCHGCRTAQWRVRKGRSPTLQCQPQGSRGRGLLQGVGPGRALWKVGGGGCLEVPGGEEVGVSR